MTRWPSNLFSSKVSSPVNLCATKTDATAPPNNVTTPKFNNIIIIVKNLPKCVTGLTSPYPTVVKVTIDHQKVWKKVSNTLGSFSPKIKVPPISSVCDLTLSLNISYSR